MSGQLVLRVLGEPDQGVIEEFRFYEGEERTLKLQVFDYEDKQKWWIPTGSTLKVTLSGTPDDVEILDANVTVDSSDRSIFSTVLQEATTELMISGMATVEVTYSDGAQDVVRYAEKEHAIKKIT